MTASSVSPTTSGRSGAVTWDYTDHAAHYDKRADYAGEAIDQALQMVGCPSGSVVADIGAGTGKLTKELLRRGLTVRAVEPNDAMRAFGVGNTRGQHVTWSSGTGEATGLETGSVCAAFFGSSFNVVDRALTLAEVARILVPKGWFVCMWNHRELSDPVQERIEGIIQRAIPSYTYGSRREDPTALIDASGRFSSAHAHEGRQVWNMARADVSTAWRSHATLRRQAGSDAVFDRVIDEINTYLDTLADPIAVPYTTRIYCARKL